MSAPRLTRLRGGGQHESRRGDIGAKKPVELFLRRPHLES